MPTLDIPNRYLAVAPIIVTSPTTRCGTTLVQRLLSASSNGFIYGEEVGHHFMSMTGAFMTMLGHLDRNGDALDDDFARALAGRLDDWRPGLPPPAAVMRRAWVETYYQMPVLLADYGQAIGRPVWGFKWPAFADEAIRALLTLMPHARLIYVLRRPAEALRSAKARRFVATDQDAAAFCAQWARNAQGLAALGPHERILVMRYEDLLADPDGQIDRLTRFSGVREIGVGVFGVKVNTFAGDEGDGHASGQYIAPAELTAADRAALAAQAAAAAVYYPSA